MNRFIIEGEPQKIAKSLCCSTRTIYRNMGNQLKLEKELLNSEL